MRMMIHNSMSTIARPAGPHSARMPLCSMLN
jgi:hypothetical protein